MTNTERRALLATATALERQASGLRALATAPGADPAPPQPLTQLDLIYQQCGLPLKSTPRPRKPRK